MVGHWLKFVIAVWEGEMEEFCEGCEDFGGVRAGLVERCGFYGGVDAD